MNYRAVGFALALGLAARAAPASAEEPPVAEAGEAFRAGERAFAEDDYPEALRLFRRAFELAPHPAVRFNIAVCLERLGRFREAMLEYRAVEQADLDDATREAARRHVERTRERLGTLVVRGPPEGTSVTIDGVPMCTVPCRLQLDPGTYRVVVGESGEGSGVEATVERGTVSELRLLEPGPPESSEPEGEGSSHPGALTWIGVGVVAAGVAGIIGFGVHTEALQATYLAMPTSETRDEGLLMRGLANASIGFAALGAVLVLVDVVLALVEGDRTSAAAAVSSGPPVVRF